MRLIPRPLTALLSPDERARAAAIISPAPRSTWPRSRALLRLLLARYSGAPAAQLALGQGSHGKPRLAHGEAPHFNLSHSGPIVLYAFSADSPVGIDVERAGSRPESFLRRWTRHEAALKCLGVGLAAGGGLREPWLCELELGDRAFAALACRREPAEIERFCWTPGAA